MEITGTSNRIIEVNLTQKDVKEIRVHEKDRKMYLGAKGLGLKLLYDRLIPGIDPLGEDNYLAFMMGVFMGTGAPWENPVCMIIDEQGVDFEDASAFWGMDAEKTQESLQVEKKCGILAIGPAGENRVPIANIRSGDRFLGRGGMGAVMGSKNLKAIVATETVRPLHTANSAPVPMWTGATARAFFR